MNLVFGELFNIWCISPEHWEVPPSLKDHPTTAYGEYAFETGFKLGMQLAVCSLDPDALAKLD